MTPPQSETPTGGVGESTENTVAGIPASPESTIDPFKQNAEFLYGIFGIDWLTAHITSFPDDPLKMTNDRRGICWAGGYAGSYGINYDYPVNQYYCISQFYLPYTPDKDDPSTWGQKPVRQKEHFKACYVIVADDVKEKVPEAQAKLLPAPSFRLETSPGNEQWGWILGSPETDRDRVDNLLDGLVAQGLAPDGKDPGMKGVTRYVRLPGGWNTKSKYGSPYKCQLLEWQPDRKVSLEQLAQPFGIDLTRKRSERAFPAVVDKSQQIFRGMTCDSECPPI